MFAAKAGAKHVVGVECPTSSISAEHHCANGLLAGKLEDIELPIQEFDIIISEWMGYFLLYESMLDTVLLARDKYLKKDGLIFPDNASLYIAAIEDQDYKEEKINFWDNVYGFDYSCIKDIALREPLVDTVELKAVVTNPCMVKHIDLRTAKKEDLTFDVPFSLTATRNDCECHAFLAWFDILFDCTHKKVSFSTVRLFLLLIPIPILISSQILTRQTVFYTPTTLTLNEGDAIKGTLKCAPNARNNRDLDITIDYSTPTTSETIAYKMCVLSLLHNCVPSVRLAGRLGTSLTNCQVLITLHQLIVFYALHACIIKYCRYR
ncbi:type protein arginine N-methyltransferase Rmt [Salix suchowensis]|nr:type protein arginine N-methyltransferase Rmt [Salix suchowensis]